MHSISWVKTPEVVLMGQRLQVELHEEVKRLLDDTQARLVIGDYGKWTYNRILRYALNCLRKEYKLDDKKDDE